MFFEKLEKLMKVKETNLNQLSKAIGVSQGLTTRWKQGKLPSAETLIEICKYFNVSADYLLDLKDSDPLTITSLTSIT